MLTVQEFVEQFQFIDISAAKQTDKKAATQAILASANLESGMLPRTLLS